jgi:hypothetical protein
MQPTTMIKPASFPRNLVLDLDEYSLFRIYHTSLTGQYNVISNQFLKVTDSGLSHFWIWFLDIVYFPKFPLLTISPSQQIIRSIKHEVMTKLISQPLT